MSQDEIVDKFLDTWRFVTGGYLVKWGWFGTSLAFQSSMKTAAKRNIATKQMGLKAALLGAFFISVFSSTSFAAEVNIPVKKSCAGQAEPNFFHVDKTGFEDVEMSLQETEYGPELQIGDDLRIFFGGGSDPKDPQSSLKDGRWCAVSKNPKKINPKTSQEAGKAGCSLFETDTGKPDSNGRVVNKPLPVTIGGKQFSIQTEYTTNKDGKTTDAKMWIKKEGEDVRVLLNPEVSQTGSKRTSKLKVDALNMKSNKIVGRTESAVEGSVDESGSPGSSHKFKSCTNLLKTGKKAASDYRVPKNTKDLNGDHHPVGSQLGYNDQFKAESYENLSETAPYKTTPGSGGNVASTARR